MKKIIFCFISFLIISSNLLVAQITYQNPRVYNLDISFEMKPDFSKIYRDKDLKLWMPLPREWDSQKNVRIISIEPEPDSQFTDPEYGNKICYWDFGKYPERPSYRVDMKVRLISFSVQTNIDTSDIIPYDKKSEEYQLYTRSGFTIHITPKVEELAREAVKDETNPFLKAQKILEFAHRKIKYNHNTRFDQGLKASLDYMLSKPETDERSGEEYFAGDCAHYSALFTALCRAEKIPARCVYGRIGWGPYLNETNSRMYSVLDTMFTDIGFSGAEHHGLGPHMWSEFYLQNIGWIPVDANAGVFGWLHHYKIIMSKGRDIFLGPDTPLESHNGYGYQWVPIHEAKVDGLLSVVYNIKKIHEARSNVYHTLDPFPADAMASYMDDVKSDKPARLINKRLEFLSCLDYCSRNIPNRNEKFSELFKDPSWIQSLQYDFDAFVCHMLNKIMGDEKFFQLAEEYERLLVSSDSPISTSKFIELANNVNGESLAWFFDQWKKENGLPQFKLEEVNAEKNNLGWNIKGILAQTGKSFFKLPVNFTLVTDKGEEEFSVWQNDRLTKFEYQTSNKPLKLKTDEKKDILKLQKMPLHLSRIWDSYPEMILIYGTIAESEANKKAAERFNDDYLGLNPEIIKPDTFVTESDLNTECVVLFGRPETNKISRRFENLFPIRFNKNNFHYNGKTYSEASQGLAMIAEHPFKAKGQLILYAGLNAKSTLQFGDLYLYDSPNSIVIFEDDKILGSGDWKNTNSKMVWNF